MFNFPRRVASSYSRQYLTNSHRLIYSGRLPQLSLNSVHSDTENNGNKNSDGYGDKEIFLLGPVDIRTPLPGNVGIPPLSRYLDKIRQLPEPAGEKCDVIESPLPEDRYHATMAQVACVAVEKVLASTSMLECVAHECPQLLKKDFVSLFPDRNLSTENLTVLTLCQKAKNNMSEWSESCETERGKLGKYFVIAAHAICARLRSSGYWADFIHPDSGRPHSGHLSDSTMFETDLRYRFFGFRIEDLGCCKVISHHRWGSHAFVGAVFTNAPLGSFEVNEVMGKNNLENSELSYSEI